MIIKRLFSPFVLLFVSITLLFFSCKNHENGNTADQNSSDSIKTRTLKATAVELKAFDLPDYVLNMTQLETLVVTGADCDYHQGPPCYALLKIPNNIEKLRELRYLDLRNNAIKEIPDNLKDLKNLEVLDLSGNPLENTANLANLPRLKALFLYDCNLKSLPENIVDLTQLRKLALGGNKIPRPEILRISKALPECEILL